MEVHIWSDIACPWCYVGKRRFEQALAGFAHHDAVTVRWRSFELDPHAPASHDLPQPQLLARKYGVTEAEARQMNARMTQAAAGEGLVFDLDRTQVGNTFNAHRLLHFAEQCGRRDALTERMFSAYLSEGESLGDPDTLLRLAAAAGLDAERVRGVLGSDRFADDVRADEAEARAIGATGVPFFVFDGRYGVSGAQPSDVLRGVLQRAWDERTTGVPER